MIKSAASNMRGSSSSLKARRRWWCELFAWYERRPREGLLLVFRGVEYAKREPRLRIIVTSKVLKQKNTTWGDDELTRKILSETGCEDVQVPNPCVKNEEVRLTLVVREPYLPAQPDYMADCIDLHGYRVWWVRNGLQRWPAQRPGQYLPALDDCLMFVSCPRIFLS